MPLTAGNYLLSYTNINCENWQVVSVICSYAAMACDVLLIVAMIIFLLKYRKTMQAMLTAFLQMNTKNTGIQSVQADQIGRTY